MGLVVMGSGLAAVGLVALGPAVVGLDEVLPNITVGPALGESGVTVDPLWALLCWDLNWGYHKLLWYRHLESQEAP